MNIKSYILAAVLCSTTLISCNKTNENLSSIAFDLCQYIPDHELLERSKDYMTEDFYSVLETTFNLPEHEAMDHEWLHYFVTGNGGTIADYEVVGVEKTDDTHAVATISVRQKWEDGSFCEEEDIEEHKLYMEKVDGKWLMSDFDGHKQDCQRYILNWGKEEMMRQTISEYLVKEIGPNYSQGDICIPVLMLVATVDEESYIKKVLGDFWVFNYNIVGDTLKTVSGGNHSGALLLSKGGGERVREEWKVTNFEQTEDGAGNEESAKRIFGDYYDVYQNMHANQDVREAVRREQLQQYVRSHNMPIKYYQDYGWDAVEL